MPTEVQISRDVLVRHLDGESVLLDLKSQRYFGLDAVGTRIWQLLEEHAEPRTVLEQLIEEFDAPRPRLEQDLKQFLSRLEAAALITVVRPETQGDARQAP